ASVTVRTTGGPDRAPPVRHHGRHRGRGVPAGHATAYRCTMRGTRTPQPAPATEAATTRAMRTAPDASARGGGARVRPAAVTSPDRRQLQEEVDQLSPDQYVPDQYVPDQYVPDQVCEFHESS